MNPLLEGIIEGLQDGSFASLLQSYCEHWREHPTQYALAFAISHAIQGDKQQLVYKTLADPDFRKLRSDGFGVNSLRADIQSALNYFSIRKPYLLRYYQLLFLGQQINIFTTYHNSPKYQNYCQAYLQFLQLNEPPNRRKNIGISRVLNRLFPIEFTHQKQGTRHRLELINYEIGNWRCQCGARQGHAQRYDLGCKACKIQTGNGEIDENEEKCTRCGGSITYVKCPKCNTRVTLDIVWRIENGVVHPREMVVPLNVSLRRLVDGLPRNDFSLTLLQLPVMIGICEKSGTLRFDSPGVLWMDTPNRNSTFFIFDEDIKYDRQTEPLKIFEALLSRTFRVYNPEHIQHFSLKSRLQRGHSVSQESFTRGFSRRIAKIARATSPILTDFAFDCQVSAANSLSHNMAIMNRNSILTKNLVASSVDSRIISLSPDDTLTHNPLNKGVLSNLDDDGIVTVGTLVKPGDVIVGIERPDKTSAKAKLIRAIYGDGKILIKNMSIKYDGILPARVIAIDVFTSNESKEALFHSYVGKTIRQADLSQDEETRISITLSLEQPIGIGDTLYAGDGSEAVICQIVDGHELRDLAGGTIEPDLIVSTKHAWATTLSKTSSSCSSLEVFIKPETLIERNIQMRGSDPYSIITYQPIRGASKYNIPQSITKKDLSCLLSYHLINTSFELMQMHSDCFARNIRLYELALKSGFISLDDIESESFSPPTDDDILEDLENVTFSPPTGLVNAPSGTVRYLAFLLRSLSINVTVELTPEPRMRFHSMEDADRVRCSHGEVTRPETLDYNTGRPVLGGLFCERIFGPTKNWECSCGKYKGARFKGTVCEMCGVDVAHSRVRRKRMGHIELVTPVINPLYLGYICEILSNILKIKVDEIISLIYYKKFVTFKEENGKKLLVFLDNYKPERKEQINWENEYLTGALAIQKLIEYHVSSSEAMQHQLFQENVIMQKVLVIPPNFRPNRISDLNYLYQRVISHNISLKRNKELRMPWDYIINEYRALQVAVDELFIKDRSESNLRSLCESITHLNHESSTLLDMLLKRSLDYTAQTRITVEHTGDIDLAFLPETLVYELFKPFIHRKSRSIANSDETVGNNNDEGKNNLPLDCSKFAILISTDSSFQRFVALRFRLTHDLSLKVDGTLMDLLGWELLGSNAKIFALFSNEAIEESLRILAPSRLLQQKLPPVVPNSVLDLANEDIITFVSTKALLQESVPIGPYEWLLTIPFRYPKQGFSKK